MLGGKKKPATSDRKLYIYIYIYIYTINLYNIVSESHICIPKKTYQRAISTIPNIKHSNDKYANRIYAINADCNVPCNSKTHCGIKLYLIPTAHVYHTINH